MEQSIGGNQVENVVLISHGDLAEGLKMSLSMVIGPQEHIHTVSLRPDGDNIQFEHDLDAKMKTLNGSTLIIADILGGTPCNVAVKNYLDHEDVDIIVGITLATVIAVIENPQIAIKDLIDLSQQTIVDVKSCMNKTEQTMKEASEETHDQDFSEFAGKANIVNARIDERLIHGQVAGIWSTSLDTQRIIVINDEAASDPLQKTSLRMAAPTSMRLSVLPAETAATNIVSGKYGKQRLFLVFKSPTDVLRFIEAGGVLDKLNVGNMSYKEGTREVTKSIQVLAFEEAVFESIADHGIHITAQRVPNDQAIDFMKKLRDVK